MWFFIFHFIQQTGRPFYKLSHKNSQQPNPCRAVFCSKSDFFMPMSSKKSFCYRKLQEEELNYLVDY